MSITPDPEVWPVCTECHVPAVLRRMMVLGAGSTHWEWLWQRDCKHKRANVEIATKEPTP